MLEKGIAPDPVTLKVDFYEGTDIQFTWDFGDGSDPVFTKSTSNKLGVVQHNYTE